MIAVAYRAHRSTKRRASQSTGTLRITQRATLASTLRQAARSAGDRSAGDRSAGARPAAPGSLLFAGVAAGGALVAFYTLLLLRAVL